MPTVVEHSSGPRNRWLLPLLLALLIAALVAGVILWPKIRQATASPTATARVVVVTPEKTSAVATPQKTSAAVTPAATVAGQATAASGTGSTPLPGASPVPTQPGLTLGMITHPQRDVARAQVGANRSDAAFTWYLDPRQVVQRQLPSYGFHNFQIVSPAASPSPTPHQGADGRQILKYIVSQGGQEYTVAVAQPARQGVGGVWFVVTILKGRHLP